MQIQVFFDKVNKYFLLNIFKQMIDSRR